MDTKVFQYKVFLSLILVAFETTICESSVSKCKGEGNLNIFFKRILNEKHSSIVGSKPLSHLCGRNTNVASASRAIWAQPKSTSTLELVPALVTLNKSTYYECEIRSLYNEKLENYFSISTQHINSHIIKKLSFDFGSRTKICVGRFNQHHITTRLTLIHLMYRTKQVGLSSAL